MDTIAQVIGYAVMGGAVGVAAVLSVELRFGSPAYGVVVLGFGPVWIDAAKHPVLCGNLKLAGYRFLRVGRWVVMISAPCFVARLTKLFSSKG